MSDLTRGVAARVVLENPGYHAGLVRVDFEDAGLAFDELVGVAAAAA